MKTTTWRAIANAVPAMRASSASASEIRS
jgi:hypothetical protein